MRLRRISDIEEQNSVYKRVAVQVETPDGIQFIKWEDAVTASENEIISLLEESVQLALKIAEQYYMHTLKSENNLCGSMFFSESFFERAKNVIYSLFSHKSAYKVFCQGFGGVIQVQAQGISDYAVTVLNKMLAEKKIPKDIENLYFKKETVRDFSDEEMYEYIATEHSSQSEMTCFLGRISKDSFIHGIDISGMSVDEFEKTGFIQSLLNENKRVYLYITKCDFKRKTYFKSIIWE